MAVSKTTRLGLTRWTEDTDPWNRDDFDDDNAALEALAGVARQGLYAARGSAATYSRSTYWATDHKALYLSDGATWRRLELANLEMFPMHTSIPRGSSTSEDMVAAATYLGDGTAIMHRMRLPGGMQINSITIARGSGADVTLNRLWFGIYSGLAGAKLAVTQDSPGTLFSNSTRSASFAAPFVVPASGIYTILAYGGSAAQFSPVGTPCSKPVSGTYTAVLGSNLAPASAPADLSMGVVERAAVPWFGLDVVA
jgi:hypothetical protein